jgi:hypothetical protein
MQTEMSTIQFTTAINYLPWTEKKGKGSEPNKQQQQAKENEHVVQHIRLELCGSNKTTVTHTLVPLHIIPYNSKNRSSFMDNPKTITRLRVQV